MKNTKQLVRIPETKSAQRVNTSSSNNGQRQNNFCEKSERHACIIHIVMVIIGNQCTFFGYTVNTMMQKAVLYQEYPEMY